LEYTNYVKSNENISIEDFKKIWTGLHHCKLNFSNCFLKGYWLTDYQQLQDELAKQISKSILFMNINTALNFLIAYYEISEKYWKNLDKHR
jgi:hypothetical protein